MIPVVVMARGAGLFSDVYSVLGHLREAEVRGDERVYVYWNQMSLYWGDEGHRGARNAWEYLFEPVSSVTAATLGLDDPACEAMTAEPLRERLRAAADVRLGYHTHHVGIPFVTDDPAADATAQRIFRDHVRVRRDVAAAASAAWNELADGHPRVVGAHYRGTDKAYEVPLVPFAAYAAALADEVAAGAAVFVATDDAAFLAWARATWPRVLARETARSTDGRPVHYGRPGPRHAEDALLDAMLLARCARLVHGSSNLAGAVGLLAPAQPRALLTVASPRR